MQLFSAYALPHTTTTMSQWHRSLALDIKQASSINIIKGLQFSQSWFIINHVLVKGENDVSYVRGGNAYTSRGCQEVTAFRANRFAAPASRRHPRHQDSWLMAHRQSGVSGLLERPEEKTKAELIRGYPQKSFEPPSGGNPNGGP